MTDTAACIDNKLAFSTFRALISTSRLQDKKLQNALAGLDVHPAQYSCLFVICEHEGVNLRQLAEGLHVENSTASVTVRRMEKAGFVIRLPDETDSRMTRLYPTEYGRKQFEKCKRVIGEFINRCFGFLSEKEQRTLFQLLGKVSSKLEQYSFCSGQE